MPAPINLANFSVNKIGNVDIERNYINDILHAIVGVTDNLQTQIDNMSGGGDVGDQGSFIVAQQESSLPNSRQLLGETGVISVDDGGAGTALTVGIAANGIGASKLNVTGTPSATTVIADDGTTLTYVEQGGGMTSVVAGDSIDVDATDPANPIVSVKAGVLVDADQVDITARWSTSDIAAVTLAASTATLDEATYPDIATAAFIAIDNTSGGSLNIGGIEGGYAGRRIVLANSGLSPDILLLLNRNGATATGDQFILSDGPPSFSSTIVLRPGNSVEFLWYDDGTDSGWRTVSASIFGDTGSVQSVDVIGGVGLTSSGGPITSTGSITLDLDNTAVTPGSYGDSTHIATFTVDAQGRLTAASQVALSAVGTVTSFSAGNLSPLFTTSVATATTTPALTFALSNAGAHTFLGNNTGSTAAPDFVSIVAADLPNTAVTPGSYGDSTHVGSFTVDAQGRLTAAASVAITYPSSQAPIQIQDEGSNQGSAGAATTYNFTGGGISAAVAGSTATINVPAPTFQTTFDPRTQYWIYDPFCTATITASGVFNATGWLAVTSEAGRPGLIRPNISSGVASLASSSLWFLANKAVSFKFGFRIGVLSTASIRYAIEFGFRDSFTGAATRGLTLSYIDNENSGQFVLKTTTASVTTPTNTSITATAGTWYDCEIRLPVGGGSSQLFINGTLAATGGAVSALIMQMGSVQAQSAGNIITSNINLDYIFIVGDM